jgi:hypothetical protein
LSAIMTALITSAVVIAFALVMTKPGQDIDAATQHFMLYYAGVFALVGLTASVAVGLVATDRIIMTPGHRVMAQAVHRAVSFGALAFLVIHIVTEILAQRAHVIDALIPFLSPYRTFYIGLGTIASDLIVLVIVSSIWRKRFTAHGKAWQWRAIHYSSYLAFVFGVMHGLLGGRAAKPYVDWSYGFAIALTALAVVVRFLVISLRSKDRVSAPSGADRTVGGLGYSGTSPLRAAALSMTQAQLSGTIQMLPTAAATQGSDLGMRGSQAWAALPPAPDWWSSGPLPALSAAPAYATNPTVMPLSAPVYGEAGTAGTGGYPYPSASGRQPWYEPEYDGPPRFEGAPRKHVPQDDLSSYPYAAQSYQPSRSSGRTGALPLGPAPRLGSGPMPRVDSGPVPRVDSGPVPRVDSGPMPRLGTGPMPRIDTGPMPRLGSGPTSQADSGPMPRPGSGPIPRLVAGPVPRSDTGPMPRIDTGPMPRLGSGPTPQADSGPMPRLGTGPMPRIDTGPMPRLGTGLMPRIDTGPMPRLGTGPMPRIDTGPMPRLGAGPMPRADSGPMPRLVAGPVPRPDTGPMPRIDSGPTARPGAGQAPRADSSPMPRADTGPTPRIDTGPMPRPGTGPMPRADSGPRPRPGPGPQHGTDSGAMSRNGTGLAPRSGTGPNPRPGAGPRPWIDAWPGPGRGPLPGPGSPHGPRTGSMPATATRRSRRTHVTDPRHCDTPGRAGGDEWR